jgi:hypothetical protein
MRDVEWDLQQAENILERIRLRIEADSTVGITAELMETIEKLDQQYKEFCADVDDDDNLDPGTTYNDEFGPNTEFYIEADDWHKISQAFRKIKRDLPI